MNVSCVNMFHEVPECIVNVTFNLSLMVFECVRNFTLGFDL